MPKQTRPDFRAYTIIKRGRKREYWQPIGAAFHHRDGAGINVVLQAVPLDGQIVLRRPADEERKAAARP